MGKITYVGSEFGKENPQLIATICDKARSREWPSSPDRLVVLLTANPDPLPLMAVEAAIHHILATPLAPRNVGALFQDPVAGKALLQGIRDLGVRVIVVDGLDPGKTRIAAQGLDGTVVDCSVLEAFVATDISPVRIWSALLQYVFEQNR